MWFNMLQKEENREADPDAPRRLYLDQGKLWPQLKRWR